MPGSSKSYKQLLPLESASEDEGDVEEGGEHGSNDHILLPTPPIETPAVEIHDSAITANYKLAANGYQFAKAARRGRQSGCSPTKAALMLAVVLLCLGVGYLAGFLTPSGLLTSSPRLSRPSRSWRTKFADYGTESCVRLVDADGDGLDDVIIGLALGKDVSTMVTGATMDDFCRGNGMKTPCAGAVVALRGYDGKLLWKLQTYAEIFELNCHALDANKDGILDCIATGRLGDMVVIHVRTGEAIWEGSGSYVHRGWNFYGPTVIPDLDYDGVPDIVVPHGGDPTIPAENHTRKSGWLVVVSGATGRQIGRHLEMPESKETYMSTVLHERRDGSQYILFGSGGETVGGLLMAVSLPDLYRYIHLLPRDHLVSNVRGKYGRWGYKEPGPGGVLELFRVEPKGVMVPPVLVDVNKDGVKDILVSGFEGTMLLFDGETLEILWKVKMKDRESYSTSAPGYFNDDDILDFMTHWSQGEWPFYNTTDSVVIDGRDGSILWNMTTNKYDVTSDLVARTDAHHRDVFIFRVQGRLGDDPRQTGAIHGATGIQRVVTRRSLPDGGFDLVEEELEEGGDFPGILLPEHHFRRKRKLSSDYIECEADQSIFLAELFAVDRTTMHSPVKLWEKGSEKYYYKLTPRDRELVEAAIKHYGANVTVSENEVPWSRGRREASLSNSPYCITIQPDERTTGALGDVDGDGRVDVIVNLVSVGVLRDERARFVKMKFDTDLFKISLEDLLQQPLFVPVNVSLSERMRHLENENHISTLRFLPRHRQTWGAYMGTNGDSVHRDI